MHVHALTDTITSIVIIVGAAATFGGVLWAVHTAAEALKAAAGPEGHERASGRVSLKTELLGWATPYAHAIAGTVPDPDVPDAVGTWVTACGQEIPSAKAQHSNVASLAQEDTKTTTRA